MHRAHVASSGEVLSLMVPFVAGVRASVRSLCVATTTMALVSRSMSSQSAVCGMCS